MPTAEKKLKTNSSIVVDGARGWIIVVATFMIHFIMDGITYSMGQVFLEPMRKDLLLARASVSSIFSILPAVTLGAGPIATVLTNKYGCRSVAMTGAALASLGFFLSRWWANIWFYYVTIGMIGGLGFSLMYLPAIVSVGLHFERKRAFAMGVAVCGSGVGTFVLSYIMHGIVNVRSWLHYSNALLIEAAIILVGLLCGFFMTTGPLPSTEQQSLEQTSAVEQLITSDGSVAKEKIPSDDVVLVQPSKKSFFGQLVEQIDLKLLSNTAFTLFVISNFLTSLGLNVVYNFADDLANDSQVVKGQRTYIIMSIGLSNLLGRLLIGYLGDRKWINRLLLFILTLLISGVATMVAPLCGSSVIPHIGYASLFGFFSGDYVALTSVVLIDIVGTEKLSDAFGVLLLFIGIATAIGTPIAGAMRDAFSHFARPFLWPYLILGGCTVLSGVILFAIPLLQRKKPNKQQANISEEDRKVDL